jgi:beta-glucanase (GH16 family)
MKMRVMNKPENMKLYRVLYALILLSMLSFAGCDDSDDTGPTVKLPSNLQISVDVSTDGSGKVDVTATANDAAYYMIYFGDAAPETPVQTTTGTASHVYANSGTYTIKVNAHATPNDLIAANKEVTVNISFQNTGYTSPETRDGYVMAWQDEFAGTSLNETFWNYEIGAGGWGNNELEYYRKENTSVADGFLIITAKKESFSGSNYTSSRLTTKDKKDFIYGRMDIRAKIPKGQGIWPALWMLGDNISDVGWPACGEIDIMEMIGGSGRENTVYGTVHWSDVSGHAQYGGNKTLSTGTFSDEFHVYSIEWNAQHIKWFIDDVAFKEIDITPPNLSEFHAPQFFIFNVAVGGNWPGSPNDATIFPQQMIVDYVRVFQPQ